MKYKALTFAALVVSCQPTPIYPQTVIDSYSFGVPESGIPSVTLFNVGNGCEDIVFDNQMAGSTNVVVTRLGGHYITITMGSSLEADLFSVEPDKGYTVTSENDILVEEYQIGTITVCMEAMS